MKKTILVLAVFLFPAIVIAQTTSLYDEWSPMLFGTKAHFVISHNEIVITFPQEAETGPIAAFLAPAMPSPAAPQVNVKSDPAMSHTTKVKLLKVVYDSAQAKGRFFVSIESKYDTNILPLRFLLKDNGEAEIGLAGDLSSLLGLGKKQSLKQLEKATSSSAKKTTKKRHGESNYDYNFFSTFSDFSVTFYNKARTAEFAKMKDPQAMPKEEMIGMMNSFGDRLAAELQKMPQDTSTGSFNELKLMGPLFKTVPQMVHNLFIAHGYNPLAVAAVISKFEKDSDVMVAGKAFSDKIEESVPALRERKANREIARQEGIKAQIGQLNNVYHQRSDLILNLIDAVKATKGVDYTILDEVINTRSKVAGSWLTPEIAKDSLTLAKFQKAQDDLSSATSNLLLMIGKNPALQSQENISVHLLSQIEGQENRIRVEIQDYNELLSNKYSNPEKVQYYSFTGKKYQHLTPEELHPSDSVMTPDKIAPAPPPPPPPAYAPAELPVPLQKISVDYPAEAKSAGIEGKVNFSALVGKDGNVIKVTINKSDNKLFNQAVIDAVKKIHFTPMKKLPNGEELTKVWYTQTISFKMNQDTAGPEESK